jgi:uncharacterized protein YcbK (DUF882 family)
MRRLVLRASLVAAATTGALPARALASAAADHRRLAFVNTHTGERLDVVYHERGRYLDDALASIDRLLRDHRSDEVTSIDRDLLDSLVALRAALDTTQPLHVISGYRSPTTNARLAAASSGVARASLHLQGRAIDIRVPGRPLARVRAAALALRAGGVGFYPRSDFVHLDTGRVRSW